MKRGKPLARRTPLVAKTELRAKTELHRGGPLNAVSAKRRKVNGQRIRVVSAMRLAAQGRCARCGRHDLPVHGHERLSRAQGGSIVAPDCLLCNPCNGWCEDNPQIAAWTGWKVSNKWPHDPALEIGTARDLNGNVVVFADLTAGAA